MCSNVGRSNEFSEHLSHSATVLLPENVRQNENVVKCSLYYEFQGQATKPKLNSILYSISHHNS